MLKVVLGTGGSRVFPSLILGPQPVVLRGQYPISLSCKIEHCKAAQGETLDPPSAIVVLKRVAENSITVCIGSEKDHPSFRGSVVGCDPGPFSGWGGGKRAWWGSAAGVVVKTARGLKTPGGGPHNRTVYTQLERIMSAP